MRCASFNDLIQYQTVQYYKQNVFMKMAVFWDAVLRSLVVLTDVLQKLTASIFGVTILTTCQHCHLLDFRFTQCYIPEG
jgi:hypothetical protein